MLTTSEAEESSSEDEDEDEDEEDEDCCVFHVLNFSLHLNLVG